MNSESTQPEALREAAWIAIGRFARSIARDDAEVAPPKYLLDAIAALEAHGAPGNWVGSIPAEESDEEFARQIAEFEGCGHQAQAVASSPEAADDAHIFSAIEALERIRDDSVPGEMNAAEFAAETLHCLAETQRSSHTAGSDETTGVGAEPPAMTDGPEDALARHIAAAKALLPPGTCVGAVGTRCLMKD